MVGSDPNLVAIVVPIVALVALAFWLGLCFYAGNHPFWRDRPPASRQQLTSTDQAAPLPPPAASRLSGPPDSATASTTARGASDAPGVHRVGDG
jgi:hypothetical protein